MTTRDKLIEAIQNAVDGCAKYWAGLIADNLIKKDLIVDETVHSPIVLLEKDMNILDFICPKCNKVVSMVELSTIGNPCIDPQPNIEEVKNLSQVHYKYCMYCGAKLKE